MIYVHDIEVYPNFFSDTIINYRKDETFVFEISERRNDFIPICNFFMNNPMYLIGWNSKHYDDPHIFMMIKRFKQLRYESAEFINQELYSLTQTIIDKEERHGYYFPPYDVNIGQVDLFLYWSKLIRTDKKVNLKSAMSLIDYPNIQDLPYAPGTWLTPDQMQDVVEYNYNDTHGTKMLAAKMKDDMNLKFLTSKKYNGNYLSMDGVNMGIDILKKEYAGEVGIDPKTIEPIPCLQSYVNLGEIIDPSVKFETVQMKKGLDNFRQYDAPTSKKVDKTRKWQNKVLLGGNLYVFGLGGLHTKDQSDLIRPRENSEIWAIDATSYYPHLTFVKGYYPSHLDPVFVELYKDKYYTRLDAKRKAAEAEARGEKDNDSDMINRLYKLLLNGYTGNLKSPYSWVYDPIANLKITINGQLFMAMLAEKLHLAGFDIISANTDGVETHVPINRKEEAKEIVKWWEDYVGIPMEIDKYKLIMRRSGNHYAAIDDRGKVKAKGDLIVNPSLFLFHANKFLVIPKAVHAYFKEGVDTIDFITNHKNIFDFCWTPRVSKKAYDVLWNDKPQQGTNRIYVSKKGKYLYKRKKSDNSLHNMLKGYAVQMYNTQYRVNIAGTDYHIFPNDINYDFYINAAEELIRTIDSPQMSLF